MGPQRKRRDPNRKASGKGYSHVTRYLSPTIFILREFSSFLGAKWATLPGLAYEMGLVGRVKVPLQVPHGRTGLKVANYF